MATGEAEMKLLDVDEAGTQYAMGAAIDADEQARKYWPLFSPQKQKLGLDLKELAHLAYGINGSKVYLNPREKFLTVSIKKPKVSVQWTNPVELANMYAFVQANGVEVVGTRYAGSLLFRIPK